MHGRAKKYAGTLTARLPSSAYTFPGISVCSITAGGLVTSTVLSLLVVPVIFTYVDDFEQWLRGFTRQNRKNVPEAANQAV